MLAPRAQHLVVAATALSVVSSFSASSPYQCFQTQPVIDPGTGKSASVLEGTNESSKKLVVVLPQLGEFDSSEFCEFLVAAQPKNILRVLKKMFSCLHYFLVEWIRT